MIRSLWISAAGMRAQQLNIDTISHNLSNVNTNGYKRSRAEFQELLYQQLHEPDDLRPLGLFVGHGVKPSAIQRMFGNGPATRTENPYDLAIQGAGFFRLMRPGGGEVYTRDGAFHLDPQGRLTSAGGFLLLGEEGPVRIPDKAERVTIDADGAVNVLIAGSDTVETVAHLNLAIFANPSGLLSLGENLYAPSAASGKAALAVPADEGAGSIAQGYLEGSNVEVVDEMVALIVAQRAYEINAKAAQSSDEMLGMANNLRR